MINQGYSLIPFPLYLSTFLPPILTPLHCPTTSHNVPLSVWVDFHTQAVTEQAEQYVVRGSTVPTADWNWARLSP